MTDEEKDNQLDKLHELCHLFVHDSNIPYQYKDIHGKNVKKEEMINDCFKYLTVLIKYTLFDAEACRREIAALRRLNG